MIYYKLPFSFDRLFDNKNLISCSLGESIAQNLQLIIETRYGEHQGDMHFGCKIWDFDFEMMIKIDDYEHKLNQSFLEAVAAYEPRLMNVDVTIAITDQEVYNNIAGSMEMKKQAAIIVNATIKETAEAFYFKTVFHLNPIISA